jgi:hypothetical protein
MNRGMKATIVRARPVLQARRLKVFASVRADSGELREAQMPDREVAAILPRSVLLGEGAMAPASLLDTLAPIIVRMSEGRRVRLWQYKERWFMSFQPWRSVRFVEDPGGTPEAASSARPEPATSG